MLCLCVDIYDWLFACVIATDNKIGNDGGIAIGEALKTNAVLTQLNLRRSVIDLCLHLIVVYCMCWTCCGLLVGSVCVVCVVG